MRSGAALFLTLTFVLGFRLGILSWLPVIPQIASSSLRKSTTPTTPIFKTYVLAPTHLYPQLRVLSETQCLVYGSGWYLLLRRASPEGAYKVFAEEGRRRIESSMIPGDFVCSKTYFRSQRLGETSGKSEGENLAPSRRLRFFLMLTSNRTASRPSQVRVEQRGVFCEVKSENLILNFRSDLCHVKVKKSSESGELTLPWNLNANLSEFWCLAQVAKLDISVFKSLLSRSPRLELISP